MDDMPDFRSSFTEVFFENGALKNFAKHLCHGLFLNKVAGLTPATLLKKRLQHWCFFVNFEEFLRTSFLKEHLQRLLLRFRIA